MAAAGTTRIHIESVPSSIRVWAALSLTSLITHGAASIAGLGQWRSPMAYVNMTPPPPPPLLSTFCLVEVEGWLVEGGTGAGGGRGAPEISNHSELSK